MADRGGLGTVYWIDHYGVPTNDLPAHRRFVEGALGARVVAESGLTTAARMRGARPLILFRVGRYHTVAAYLQDRYLPPPEPLGEGCPRYGYFVRRADLDDHLRRFDTCGVPHTGPLKTSEAGEEGSVVYFSDPDGNQYELWAPDKLPEATMESDNPARIGRISHFVFECRDIERTAALFEMCFADQRINNYDIPAHTLVLGLAGGGRMIFRQVETLSDRTGGHHVWHGQHVALTVPNDEFFGIYERIWSQLPEASRVPVEHTDIDERTRPPRTEPHGGQGTKGPGVRGMLFYDWDGNNYHLMGGVPETGGSLSHYRIGYEG